jgi:hypothetical protein
VRHYFYSKKNIQFKNGIFAALFLFVAVFGVIALNPTTTYAKTESEMTLVERAQSYTYLNAMRWCVDNARYDLIDDASWLTSGDRISEANARSGDWFTDHTSYNLVDGDPYRVAASYLNPNTDDDTDATDGLALCNNVVKDSIGLWGYSDGFELLCDFVEERGNESSCRTGNGDFSDLHNYTEEFYEAIKQKVYGGATPTLRESDGSYPGRYLIYRAAFERGCKPVESNNATENFRYTNIKLVNEDGTIDEFSYEGLNRNDSKRVYIDRDNLSEIWRNCGQIADAVNEYAQAYAKYRLANRDESTTPAPPGYIDNTPCDPTVDDPCNENSSTCSINGIGWFLCPIITTTADIADGIYGFIEESFLEINVELLETTGDSAGTYVAWTVMRDIANIAFVIVFLIIIFAQLTSLGVSNYGVKKMLPRLVVAAILVNISFFLCQLAVDLSNLAGYGTKEVFTSVGESIQSSAKGENLDINNLDVNGSTGFDGWSVVSAGVILGTAGAVSYLALGSLIAVLIGAIVSILVIFFILILRQVLIVLLIVLSPLAFVAYLLPNTESLFTKWRKMFVALLLVFPITGLVFGASTLASNILVTVYGGDGQTGFDDTIAQIIAGGALVIPLIAVPFILKSALNSVGNLGSMINKIGGRASGGAGKMARKGFEGSRAGKALQYQKERRATDRALTQAGAYNGKKRWRRGVSKMNQKFNSSKFSGKSGDRLANQGLGLARETEGKEAADQATMLRSQIASGAMTNEKLDAEAAKAFKNGDRVRTKAIQDVMFEQGGSGIDRYTNAVRKAQATPGGMSGESFNAMRENINSKHGQTVKSKAAPLSKLAGVGGKLEEHEKDVDTWAMSAGDLATQTKGQLQYAADNGLINPETASAMISDRRIAERLDPSQYAALQQASKQTKETYTEKKTAKQKVEQDKVFDTYVDAGNVETYRQAGEKKAAQAAEGSSGSAPFVVDSSGSVEANTASGKARSTQAEAAQGQPSTGGVFTVDHSGTTEAPQKPAPSVLDTSPEAAKTVDTFNSNYQSMDRPEYTQPNPADISNVSGQSNTTSVNISVTAPPAETPAPVDTNNPYRTMDQSQPEKIDPSDISGVTGDKKPNNIDVPTDNNNEPDKT